MGEGYRLAFQMEACQEELRARNGCHLQKSYMALDKTRSVMNRGLDWIGRTGRMAFPVL